MKNKERATTGQLLLNHLYQRIERTTHQDPHPGLIMAFHHFVEPYPIVNEVALLSLATMDLLIQFAYPPLSGYGKFTISFTMKRSYGEEVAFTIGVAIPLTNQDSKLIPMSEVYTLIYREILRYREIYEGDSIVRLMIRVYVEGQKKDWAPLSSEERDRTLTSIIQAGLTDIDPIPTRDIHNRKRSYPKRISRLRPSNKELKPFLVADIETLLVNKVHNPYAAGLMMVRPGEPFDSLMIDTYYSDDYSPFLDSFEEQSSKVLYDLVNRINRIVRKEQSSLTIYFHNFSRFDGIILLKHLACHHKNYRFKPLLRNNRLYELAVYSGRKMLFRFRDSLNLLPGKLDSLAKNLCPELGRKGSIDHENVTISNLASKKEEYIEYLKRDVLLLGGVMQKAQEIYWKLFKVDIETKITLPSLALTIFRLKYYDDSNWPIHIPNKNEDTFIRRAYYGGHTDVYIPCGEDLYYYDVNSLYPFVMKEFPMPGGVPVWHGNLEGKDLDSMCGFIEAYVVCPKTIKRPFLPYRDMKNKSLIFPTGEFVGVYYSEELKFAKGLGYTVIPISGYLFEKKESPFKGFVSSLFESRLEARKEGNEALAYVYKILMNSLYGRFGINPKSTITEVCSEARYKHLIRHSNLIHADMLSENNYILSYHSDAGEGPDYWNPPKNSAVQLAAARIYMYPYISREDCYYTDADSVVLGSPLPEDLISSKVLGLFKLEDRIMKGYFIAPKAYCYFTKEGAQILKFKGPAKGLVSEELIHKMYENPFHTEKVTVESNFRIDWPSLNVMSRVVPVTIGIQPGKKRKLIDHKGNEVDDKEVDRWVDTAPLEVKDLSSLDHIGKSIIISLRKDLIQLQAENQILNEKLSQREREIEERIKEIPSLEEESNTEDTLLTEGEKANTGRDRDTGGETDKDGEKSLFL